MPPVLSLPAAVSSVFLSCEVPSLLLLRLFSARGGGGGGAARQALHPPSLPASPVPGACCAHRGRFCRCGRLLRSSSACPRPYRRSAGAHCARRVRPRPCGGCARRPRRSAHKRAKACARQSAARSSRSVRTGRGGGARSGAHGARPTSPAAPAFFTCSFSRRGFLPDAAARRARLALCLLLALGLLGYRFRRRIFARRIAAAARCAGCAALLLELFLIFALVVRNFARDRNADAGQLFDIREVRALRPVAERDRRTLLTGAAGAADAVQYRSPGCSADRS